MTKKQSHRSKKLDIYWTKHVAKDMKEQTEATIFNSTVALERLREICDELIQSVHSEERDKNEYENGSWAYKQAHRNGELAAYHQIRKLTDHLSSD